MTPPSNRAVFLSYASEDIAPAREIADALRAAGVQVWFDENELVGGDAWDAKIRDQIRTCALFVAVISAHTEARLEGYFRREWKLAAERTHDMAENKSFLLPVVIDDTTPSASVPAKFREIQWTHLPAGKTPAAFVERVRRLLDPNANIESTGRTAPASRPLTATPMPPAPRRRGPWLAAAAGLVVILCVTLLFWNRGPRIQKLDTGAPASEVAAPAVTTAAHATPNPKAPAGDPRIERARVLLAAPDVIVGDATLAEDLVKSVLVERPTDATATIEMARIQVYLLLRGFDRSAERFASAKYYTNRALLLAPDDPDALASSAVYMYRSGIEFPRAVGLLRRAIELRPDEPFYYRMVDNLLSADPANSEAAVIESALATAQRFPNDPLVQYEMGRHYRDAGRLAETEKYFDRAIKLGLVTNAIIARASMKVFINADPVAMRELLDRIPERYRDTQRAVFGEVAYALVTSRPERGLDALQRLPEPWMIDFDYTGPTALLKGELLLLEGKSDEAHARFVEAREEYGRHKPDFNRNFSTAWLDPWLLMRVGQLDEARRKNNADFASLRRPLDPQFGTNWWFCPLCFNLLLGDHEKAMAFVHDSIGFPLGRTSLANALRFDPRMAPFRNDPELAAIIAAQPPAAQH